MAKFGSTLRKIPWSLALKAALLALLWLVVPAWLFLAAAALAYLVPLFEPFRFALPFASALVLAAITSPNVWVAFLFGIVFFSILGAKDLVLIDRVGAYEASILILTFLTLLTFFRHFTTVGQLGALAWSFVVGAALLTLFSGLGSYLAALDEAVRTHASRRRRALAWGVAALAAWQASLVALALPLTYLAQAALVLIVVVTALGLELDYLRGRLDHARLVVHAGAFLVLAAIVLLTNRWGL